MYGKDGKPKAYVHDISERGTDVKLKELLAVPNAFETESPLPNFEMDGSKARIQNSNATNQHV